MFVQWFLGKVMNMPTIEGGIATIIAKYGLGTLLAAVGGAAIMAMFRPPKDRKEVLQHALVALGTSLILGSSVYNIVIQWIPVNEIAVHGLLGAVSWGLWAGIATYRDRFARAPVEAVKDVIS